MRIHIILLAGRAAGKTYVADQLKKRLAELEAETPSRRFEVTVAELLPYEDDTDKLEQDLFEPKHCINHPDRVSRENLDGDELCQQCCNDWARSEGDAACGSDFDA